MHIYFSGIGGAGIGPLALIAHQAGYEVSGSDMQPSQYTKLLQQKGIRLHIGQTKEQIAAEHQQHPIDWIVFSSAIFYTDPNHPELLFAKENNIHYSKRDEYLNKIISDHNLKFIAIAGTHGKTTTTALAVWIFKQLGLPISYSVGAKIAANGIGEAEAMGCFDTNSEYFIYECDEFDRNFLSFKPFLSAITIADWDHHDVYQTAEDYKQAFRQFISQSQKTFVLDREAADLNLQPGNNIVVINQTERALNAIKLPGLHNRQNALVVTEALCQTLGFDKDRVLPIVARFPGLSRRFELIAPNVYSDYAHTPEEIAATLQLAHELSDQIVAVYEPLTNRRQHYMQDLYNGVFESVNKVYWLPSYLAREDPNQPILTPEFLITKLGPNTNAVVAKKDQALLEAIKQSAQAGNLVICMAGGGGDSLDEWLRQHRDELQV
jgi:UDP-N-acetylmuramate--alanine ligase